MGVESGPPSRELKTSINSCDVRGPANAVAEGPASGRQSPSRAQRRLLRVVGALIRPGRVSWGIGWAGHHRRQGTWSGGGDNHF